MKANGVAKGDCGVLDRRSLSTRVSRFPFTDDGWPQAWADFTAREPEHWENPDPPTCPRCGHHPMRVFEPAEQAKNAVIGYAFFGWIGALVASGGRYRCPNCGLKIGR